MKLQVSTKKKRRSRCAPSSLVINLVPDAKTTLSPETTKSCSTTFLNGNWENQQIASSSYADEEPEPSPTKHINEAAASFINHDVQSSFLNRSRHLTLERCAVSTLDVSPLIAVDFNQNNGKVESIIFFRIYVNMSCVSRAESDNFNDGTYQIRSVVFVLLLAQIILTSEWSPFILYYFVFKIRLKIVFIKCGFFRVCNDWN